MAAKVAKLFNLSPSFSPFSLTSTRSVSRARTCRFFSHSQTAHFLQRFDCSKSRGKDPFADTAADVLYSTVISVRQDPYNCGARGRATCEVCTLKCWSQIAKCTLEYFSSGAVVDLAQNKNTYCCCTFFHWPSLDACRRMNHKQSILSRWLGFYCRLHYCVIQILSPSGPCSLTKYVAK